MLDFAAINYLAVIVAVLAGYLLGGIWYSPKVFGNLWMSCLDKKAEDIKGAGRTMAISFMLTFSIGLSMAFAIQMVGVTNWAGGAFLAFLISTGFILPHSINEYLFDGYNMKALAIHQGYRIVSTVIMGIILGAWQ